MQAYVRNAVDYPGSKVCNTQRYEAHLLFSATVINDEVDGDRCQQPVTLTGYTHSVSDDAIALVGPFHQFGYRYLMGRNRTLHIELHLPAGAISIQGFPARYVKLSDNEFGEGYMLTGPDAASFRETDVNCLIEVSLVLVSDDDMAQFTEYLRQLDHTGTSDAALPAVIELPQQQFAPPYAA